MMLPLRRPVPQQPSSNDATVKAPSSPPDLAGAGPTHLDYDLQPLKVDGLSHYIEPVVDEERFRVH